MEHVSSPSARSCGDLHHSPHVPRRQPRAMFFARHAAHALDRASSNLQHATPNPTSLNSSNIFLTHGFLGSDAKSCAQGQNLPFPPSPLIVKQPPRIIFCAPFSALPRHKHSMRGGTLMACSDPFWARSATRNLKMLECFAITYSLHGRRCLPMP